MHHDYLLIQTHLGANTTLVQSLLGRHPDISLCSQNLSYLHPLDLNGLKMSCEMTKKSRIMVDMILENYSLNHRLIENKCKYLFYLGDPVTSYREILLNHYRTNETATTYYSFRLQRIYNIAKLYGGCILLEHYDSKQLNGLNKFLNLKNPLILKSTTKPIQPENKYEAIAIEYYEKYLFKLHRCLAHSNFQD